MARTRADSTKRANVIDEVKKKHQKDRRQRLSFLLETYPEIVDAYEDSPKSLTEVVRRLEERYGPEQGELAKLLLERSDDLCAALLYMFRCWPEGIAVRYTDTDEKLAEHFEMEPKTIQRIWGGKVKSMTRESIWKLAIGLRMKPKQALELMDLAQNHLTDEDCVILLCIQAESEDERYPTPGDVNRYFDYIFHDSGYRLYQSEAE